MKTILRLKCWMMRLFRKLSCEEVDEFAYAYLEGELESDFMEKFDHHLRDCPNCKRFIHSYRQIARPDKLMQKIPLDPHFERKVIRFLKDNTR